MRKPFVLLAAVMTTAMLLTACGGSNNNDNAADTSEVSNFIREEDHRPPIVKAGLGFQIDLPASADDVTCMLVDKEEADQLRQQGYRFLTRPISVTRNGSNHVQLSGVATLRFDIPEDFPQDQYDELVGILITDKGPEYKIPDYYALREGVAQFETSHFSTTGLGQDKKALRERFIEEVAVNGWQRNMSNKTVEPTWREQLNKFANDHCLGEDDLLGIAMREVFGDKDIVKIGIDIVNAHDMEDATVEERIQVASENMVKIAESKLLAYFLGKLKEEDTKKVKVMDELKSEKIGETVYKTELHKIDSRRNKIIGVLEDHFSMDNAEKVGTLLGDEPSVEKCYIFACEYVGKFALDQWKSMVVDMVPYLGTVKKMATAAEIWKKFWACTQMQDLYKAYKEKADENGGYVSNDIWDVISIGVAAPEFLHGMTDAQIREKLAQRYREETEIERRKAEERKYLDLIESIVDLDAPCLEAKHFDYIQRLTIVNNLIDRFYDELKDKDGCLVFYDNGYKQTYSNFNNINEQLCYVVNEYLKCYPDRDKFYQWLSKNGFNYGQLEEEYDKLDALLWKKEKTFDPDIHIVIQETLGANSGGAKYAGHAICLGKNGEPYMGWHYNVPDNDSVHDQGWSTEYPDADTEIPLSEYKELGMPNQVLIYSSENSFLRGGSPIEIVDFEVDTMNRYTTVELSKEIETIKEFVAASGYVGYNYDMQYKDNKGKIQYGLGIPRDAATNAITNALSDVSPFFLSSKGGDISFTASGDGSDEDGTAHVELSVNGRVVLEEYNEDATATITANVTATYVDGTKITARFNLTTEGAKKILPVNGGFVCHAEGKAHVKIVYADGGTVNFEADGEGSVTYKPADSNY